MSSLQNQHPEEGMLLGFIDGELPSRKVRQIRRHLEACWECRTAVEELESTIAECVRYRKNMLQAYLPAPPQPWADLSAGFARIDAETATGSWSERLTRLFAAPAVRRWALTAAATLAIGAGLYYQLHQTPSVQAATLLKRAAAVAQAHSQPVHKIQVRTKTRQFLMEDRTAAPAIHQMFQAAHYDLPVQDPLNAQSFADWRNGLASKEDAVGTVPGPQECYRIQTTAPDGDLAVASLMLRTADLHPVEGRFEFRNSDWVEFTEVAEVSTPDGVHPVETHVEAPERRAVPPSRPAAIPSSESASISEELQVLTALHQIGADLGDPVEVTRSNDGHVQISGIGVPPQRQRDIHRAVDPIPHVTVQFSDPAPAPSTPDTPANAPAAPAAGKLAGVQARLEQYLGGRAEFERFSSQMLDWNEAAMSRAYALHALAQRFSASDENKFSAADRQVLHDLARAHAANLSAQINSLYRTLAPVLVSLGGSTAQSRPAKSYAAWQPAAEDSLTSLHRFDVLLSQLMGAVPATGATDRLPAELQASFADLRAGLENCQILLK